MQFNSMGPVLASMFVMMAPLAAANKYVPPPTGPYQSPVVINSVEMNSVEQPQVYKFPPADLIDEDLTRSSSLSKELSFPQTDDYIEPEKSQPMMNNRIMNNPPLYNYQQGGYAPGGAPPAASYPAYNPWSVPQSPDSMPMQLGNQGGVWSNPQVVYPQGNYPSNYPYGYSNGYNSTNSPFNGMPSPWSVMPMQQFFSGQ